MADGAPIDLDDPAIRSAVKAAADAAPPLPDEAVALLRANALPTPKRSKRTKKVA